MDLTGVVEGLAPPSTEPVDEGQPRRFGQSVEAVGIGVVEVPGPEADGLAVAELHMVTGDGPVVGIGPADPEDDRIGVEPDDVHVVGSLVGAVAGDERLDDDDAVRLEQLAGTPQGGPLECGGGQVEQRVEGHQHRRGGAGPERWFGHVRGDDGDRRRLPRRGPEHGDGGVEADHGETGPGQGPGEPPGSAAELDHQSLDPVPEERRGLVRRGDVGVPGVVHVGEGVAVRRRSVAVHGAMLACDIGLPGAWVAWRRMTEDHRRPAQYTSVRDDRLRGWLGTTVRSYSPALGDLLAEHGIDRPRRSTPEALRALPVVEKAALADGRRFVLEPGERGFGRSAPIAAQVRFLFADVAGRRDEFARRHIDPSFRPVLWTQEPSGAETLFVANTASDLDRLGALGRRGWATSGVRSDDRVLLVHDGDGSTAHWQMVLGCRNAGVALLVCAPEQAATLLVSAAPTVVAGPTPLVSSLTDRLPSTVRALAVDAGHDPAPLPEVDLPVAEWWVPPAARAAWVSCPEGQGFHTWPEDEVLDFVDGELVWSAVGWHGSVWLRVATGIAATVDESPCTACGRTTPRVEPRGRFR